MTPRGGSLTVEPIERPHQRRVPPKGKIEAQERADEQGHALDYVTMTVVAQEPDPERDEEHAEERQRRAHETAGAGEVGHKVYGRAGGRRGHGVGCWTLTDRPSTTEAPST